jgi:hypothetical protein
VASGGKPARLDPAALIGLAPETLRACGLSTRKADYIQDLAARFADGRIRPRRWQAMDDEAVIGELVADHRAPRDRRAVVAVAIGRDMVLVAQPRA